MHVTICQLAAFTSKLNHTVFYDQGMGTVDNADPYFVAELYPYLSLPLPLSLVLKERGNGMSWMKLRNSVRILVSQITWQKNSTFNDYFKALSKCPSLIYATPILPQNVFISSLSSYSRRFIDVGFISFRLGTLAFLVQTSFCSLFKVPTDSTGSSPDFMA